VAGSSGGAAAALATGMAWLAQGSDMGGSLRNPASFCGMVGLRPSIGRVATTPSDTVIDTLSTKGPMARNIADVALMLDAMCGHEPMDPLSAPASGTSFLAAARTPCLPRSIAYSFDLGITPVDNRTRQVFKQALEKIESIGIIVEEKSPDFGGVHEIFHTLRANNYASSLGGLLKDHEDLLDPNVVWNIKEGLKLTTAEVARAEAKRVELVTRVQLFFQDNEFLLTPATIVPPYRVEQDHVTECEGYQFDNYYRWLSIAYAFTTALCPALSMPCGFTMKGLPVGLQIATRTWGEAPMLSAAAALEDVLELNPLTPLNPKP
jgi:amidase